MERIYEGAASNLAELERALAFIDKRLAAAPPGRLETFIKNNVTFYVHVFVDARGKMRRKYLAADDALIQELACKSYYKRVRPEIVREVKSLKRFLYSCASSKIDAAYEDLSSARRKLVAPLFENPTYAYELWQAESFSENAAHPESRRFRTDNGELVRSKSELMIANELARHAGDIVYRYEQKLVLNNGNSYRPDFSTLSLRTGKRAWLEHAGLMDRPDYAESFVRKINDYQDCGLVLGKNLFITMETAQSPLLTSTIKRTVQQMVWAEG